MSDFDLVAAAGANGVDIITNETVLCELSEIDGVSFL